MSAARSRVAVRDLRENDMVDLEKLGPFGFERNTGFSVAAQYEYGVVDATAQETPDCALVHFINFPSIGLPPDFVVEIADGPLLA